MLHHLRGDSHCMLDGFQLKRFVKKENPSKRDEKGEEENQQEQENQQQEPEENQEQNQTNQEPSSRL